MDQLVNKKVLKNRTFIKRITPKVEWWICSVGEWVGWTEC